MENNCKIAKKMALKFKNEFELRLGKELYCKICAIVVTSTRKSTIEKHRSSKKHSMGLCSNKSNNLKQTFLIDPEKDITCKLVTAFLSADIPLYKLRNKELKEFFEYAKVPLVSETTARKHVSKISHLEMLKYVIYFHKKLLFLVVDESEIRRNKYFNILAGTIDNPREILLIDCIQLDQSINSTIVSNLILTTLEKYGICRRQVTMIISDAASYMKKALVDLNQTGQKILHVKCLVHLLHNCSMNIRAHYKHVDSLIATVKMITTKNRSNAAHFSNIGAPPVVIITRWSSWLRAALYYADNLPKVKLILNNLPGTGIMLQRAKEAVNQNSLTADLLAVKECYEQLIPILDNFENSLYTINSGYEILSTLQFELDPVNIKSYLEKRLLDNDITIIAKLTDDSISPTVYHLLRQCPPSSISVERSFSMLKKLLAKDRNFNKMNVFDYIFCYFNKRVIKDANEDNDESSMDEYE